MARRKREGTKTEREGMREGDDREFEPGTPKPLTFLPAPGEKFRWLPRHGGPFCVGEWIVQHAVKTFAYLPVYTAVVVTLILVIQLFGIGVHFE